MIVLDEKTILIANDNNYPFSVGRPPAIDNNEIIILQLDPPLNLAPGVGLNTPKKPDGNSGQVIQGSEGNDRLLGGNCKDTLVGKDGNDWLDGGQGNDILKGGGGRNLFVLAQGNGSDTIADFQDGIDLIGLSGNLTFSQLTIGSNASGLDIRLSTGEVLATLSGIGSGLITADDFLLIT